MKNLNRKTSKGGTRLNKYIASSGLATRREASEYIKSGAVKVNGNVETNQGYLVQLSDQVVYQNHKIIPSINFIYLLINKPKNTFIDKVDDQSKMSVLDIIKPKVKEQVSAIGPLDRDTSGLLLLTNDDQLLNKFADPAQKIKEIYHLILEQELASSDLEKINSGVLSEKYNLSISSVSYVQDKPQNEIGLEVHQGNRALIADLFKDLGYKISRLDRVYFGGLTKKDLSRGRYRNLTKQEVIMLKHFV